MSSLLDIEEEGKTSEITLSTASLLGIFFGLVLICGVFFGLGYSMGRGAKQGPQPSGPSGASASNGAEPDSTMTAEDAKPAAPIHVEQQDGTQAPVSLAPSTPVAPPKLDAAEPPAPRSHAPSPNSEVAPAPGPNSYANTARVVTSKPSAAKEPDLDSSAAGSPNTDALPSSSGRPMVQIAAVARQEDADVLVSALRKRGYGVVVRRETQDKLLHVQVGPFADHTEAAAIKQRLLADGYNAIIKQ